MNALRLRPLVLALGCCVLAVAPSFAALNASVTHLVTDDPAASTAALTDTGLP